jgi:stress-induced morphogen
MPGRDEETGASVERRNNHEQASGLAITIARRVQSFTQWWVRLNYASHTEIRILRRQRADTARMTNPSSATRADRIRDALTQAFAPAILQIQDDSARHAGHSGAPAGGQSHYSVLMVSAAFQGISRVARSRLVHEALAAEFGATEQGGMHALALTLRTPEEYAAQMGR